jgi:hypothetical protein
MPNQQHSTKTGQLQLTLLQKSKQPGRPYGTTDLVAEAEERAQNAGDGEE